MITKGALLAVAIVGLCAVPARAEIVFFATGRNVSVRSHRVDGDTIVIANPPPTGSTAGTDFTATLAGSAHGTIRDTPQLLITSTGAFYTGFGITPDTAGGATVEVTLGRILGGTGAAAIAVDHSASLSRPTRIDAAVAPAHVQARMAARLVDR